MSKKIYLSLAHMSEAGLEKKFVEEAFDTDWVAPLGPNVDGFEEALKQYIGQGKEVVALSSGTAAVHLALVACGVGPGDEVIVQSFTFCASSHPVTYMGAKPVFVDSEPDTWNMDPELLEMAIRDRIAKTGRAPKAIIPVTLYGMPYKADSILSVAQKYGIAVIEDSAEGLGSTYNGRQMGTFGKYGVLSFNGNKMITTSGGGALICPDREEWSKVRKYATQAREDCAYYQHEMIGYNYRMSNVCAGIGRGQMTVLDGHIAHHRHVQALYEELLACVPGITVHTQPSGEGIESNFWLTTVVLDPALHIKGQEKVYCGAIAAGCRPNDNVETLRDLLDEAGIESRPLWKPMHLQPVYKDAPAYLNGVSESLFRTGLCLPAGPRVSDENVKYIVETIKNDII